MVFFGYNGVSDVTMFMHANHIHLEHWFVLISVIRWHMLHAWLGHDMCIHGLMMPRVSWGLLWRNWLELFVPLATSITLCIIASCHRWSCYCNSKRFAKSRAKVCDSKNIFQDSCKGHRRRISSLGKSNDGYQSLYIC